ncbi:MAG: glycosyl hydrolase [Chloroflexi bacterium]|nr:glycosyl hydrolase [Chloroflexota bacterium]
MTEPSPGVASLQDSLLSSLEWRCIGPHRGGRCVAVAGDVSDPMTFYFGACAGGVWKTTDGGTYWRNVSDGFLGTSAIGAVDVSASDPNVIYVGTGEACIRNNVSHGDGVYRSTDAGKTWQNVGLRDSRHIGCIRVHPQDPDIAYVAALGHAFGPNDERGVFRTTNGGQSWDRVLFKSPHAGCHDISMDPHNPRILYAAVWQTQRYPHTLQSGGPESGVWRSTDGGDTWTDITRRPGLPTGVLGKIGVAASPARSGRVWALIEAEDGALFRSEDGGETWARVCEDSALRTRPWYYIHVFADPRDPDTCWVLNYKVWKSVDGGNAFTPVPIPHGDNHGLWIDPNNPLRMIEGNDGGACVTFNGGQSWSSIYNQPTAQLYHVTTDNQFPYRVYGSQQDNTAISVPSLSFTGPITQEDWYVPGGGESGYIGVKPDDPNVVAASGPAGRRIFNDYMTLYNHRTREKRDITVWPELYGWGVGADALKYRFQWTFPIAFSMHNPEVLYAASNHLHRSRDLGASWEVISPDLTRNDPDKLGPSGGAVTRDNTGAEVYCTIFALAESPLDAGMLWAGSDDGRIHLSRDGGATWRDVTPRTDILPEWALVSIIEPSPHDPATVYVAATRYKLDDTRPYLCKSNDFGQTWVKITSGIPDHEFTRVIREDPKRRGLLYVGTETGLYASLDDGANWQRLGGNLPVTPIHDLVIKGDEMVVATHGRSFWILDDISPVRQLTADRIRSSEYLFQPRPTYRLRLASRRLAQDANAQPDMVNYARADASLVSFESSGGTADHLLDAGANPPAGVQIFYYLREQPADDMRLEILDGAGAPIRSFDRAELHAHAGLNRFVWSMRYPAPPSVQKVGNLDPWERSHGPMVLPGPYRARLVVNGQRLEQPFEILADPRLDAPRLNGLSPQLNFLHDIYARLSACNELINRINRVEDQIASVRRWAEADAFDDLRRELCAIKEQLIDVNMSQAQLYASGLHEKLNALIEFVESGDYAPAQQARDVFRELCAQLDSLAGRFDAATRSHLPELSRHMAQAVTEEAMIPT